MKQKTSKTEAKEGIQKFFEEIKNKSPKEIKKIKKIASSKKIPLKEKRKLFCKKCLHPYQNPKTRINKKNKSITCKNCGYLNRWKVSSSS